MHLPQCWQGGDWKDKTLTPISCWQGVLWSNRSVNPLPRELWLSPSPAPRQWCCLTKRRVLFRWDPLVLPPPPGLGQVSKQRERRQEPTCTVENKETKTLRLPTDIKHGSIVKDTDGFLFCSAVRLPGLRLLGAWLHTSSPWLNINGHKHRHKCHVTALHNSKGVQVQCLRGLSKANTTPSHLLCI